MRTFENSTRFDTTVTTCNWAYEKFVFQRAISLFGQLEDDFWQRSNKTWLNCVFQGFNREINLLLKNIQWTNKICFKPYTSSLQESMKFFTTTSSQNLHIIWDVRQCKLNIIFYSKNLIYKENRPPGHTTKLFTFVAWISQHRSLF